MKTLKEILGLRIISVASGTQIGHVKDYVLNPQNGALDFFITDQPNDHFGARVISFTDIVGLGEFALTIPDPQVIQDVARNLPVQELLKQDVRVIGTKVLTKKGQLVGEVKELAVNEETGKIESCIYESEAGESREISFQQILTYGKELLIIEPEQTNHQVQQKVINEKPEDITSEIENTQEINQPDIIDDLEQESEFNLFEQRQLQYFIGKRVDKDISLDNGEILPAGQAMTEETVSKIKTRSTMMEITSHLFKG